MNYKVVDTSYFYFIPDLFEDIEPAFEWDSDQVMHFRYNYDDFPPDAFMTRFIVEMHENIIEGKRWRSGVYISNDSCKAKVYQRFKKNFIHIEIIGNLIQRRWYLHTIREVFRVLHKPFPNMKIVEEVNYKDHWIGYKKLEKFEEKNKVFYHDELDEDIDVIAILGGYTNPFTERASSGFKTLLSDFDLRILKIFLASSNELKKEREKLEQALGRKNKVLRPQGFLIELSIWEDAKQVGTSFRSQDNYNLELEQCNLFAMLFYSKLGKYSLEEFENAKSRFDKMDMPRMLIFQKNKSLPKGQSKSDAVSRFDFLERLKELEHFPIPFKNVDQLAKDLEDAIDKLLLEDEFVKHLTKD